MSGLASDLIARMQRQKADEEQKKRLAERSHESPPEQIQASSPRTPQPTTAIVEHAVEHEHEDTEPEGDESGHTASVDEAPRSAPEQPEQAPSAVDHEPVAIRTSEDLVRVVQAGLEETEVQLKAFHAFGQEQRDQRFVGASADGVATATVDGKGVIRDLALHRRSGQGTLAEEEWWDSVGASVVDAVAAARQAAGSASDTDFLARFPSFRAAFDETGR